MEQSQNLSFRSTITGTALKLNLIVQNLNLFDAENSDKHIPNKVAFYTLIIR